MKVILSRKGTDSSFGGFPSIILPDNTFLSFPIPGDDDEIRYSDVKTIQGLKMSDIIVNITNKVNYYGWKEFGEQTHCHLDPDLLYDSLPRRKGWKGCFGQSGAAQTVLERHRVGKGDLFLFFGWFRPCILQKEKYVLDKKRDMHCIYGYMQIGEVIHTSEVNTIPDWLKYHPHALRRRMERKSNCIYIANEVLSWDKSIKGYGVLQYNEWTQLTKPGCSRSHWKLPQSLRKTSIGYHSSSSWKEEYFQSACRGQEFVLEETLEAEQWAYEIINSGIYKEAASVIK